ncbi:MAG: SH3 domain-containing protein [Nitrosomonadales bacterium]|nr:SH3 domain-containing protein [Nitrosomonadales bacterium]
MHKLLLSLMLVLMPGMASALDFRSISVPKAVLFDAPSAQAKKLFVIWQGYPVEIIVNLGDWVKVRDNQGGLTWVESKNLSPKRTVIVVQGPVEMREAANLSANVLSRLEKDVVLDLVETTSAGWVKVKHRDGLTGYVQAAAVWGL